MVLHNGLFSVALGWYSVFPSSAGHLLVTGVIHEIYHYTLRGVNLSVRRQGELLGLSRSSIYYQAKSESVLNLQLIRLIEEKFERTPFCGCRKMTAYLRRMGFAINGKRVRRLMRLMGIQAIFPRRKGLMT